MTFFRSFSTLVTFGLISKQQLRLHLRKACLDYYEDCLILLNAIKIMYSHIYMTRTGPAYFVVLCRIFSLEFNAPNVLASLVKVK